MFFNELISTSLFNICKPEVSVETMVKQSLSKSGRLCEKY